MEVLSTEGLVIRQQREGLAHLCVAQGAGLCQA